MCVRVLGVGWAGCFVVPLVDVLVAPVFQVSRERGWLLVFRMAWHIYIQDELRDFESCVCGGEGGGGGESHFLSGGFRKAFQSSKDLVDLSKWGLH